MRRALMLAGIVAAICVVARAARTQQANQQSQTQATPMQAAGQRAGVPQAKVTVVVRDQSGAAIPSADVQIQPIGITLRTDADGVVSVALPLGTYGLVVSDSGFSIARERVIVREPAAQTIDVVLKLGPTGSPIVVTAPMPPRKVAITFDDLPAFSSDALNGTQIVEQNERLLGTLQREKIPAIGFVNAAKLYKWGQVDERIKALQIWLDDGFELGNHTYSHESLNKVGLKAWEENVVEGEPLLKLLLAQHGMTLRYYRPPYLDMGADLLTRRQAEQFLASRGYRVAPITIDVGDWEFAPIYFAAKQKGDTAEEGRVVSAFLDYANASLDYAERFSKQIIGYEPTQVILLHDSELEADHFAELAALMS